MVDRIPGCARRLAEPWAELLNAFGVTRAVRHRQFVWQHEGHPASFADPVSILAESPIDSPERFHFFYREAVAVRLRVDRISRVEVPVEVRFELGNQS